jgi:hypothetical protein
MSMRFSNTELHLFLARGEQAAQGNYSRDKDMILGGDIYTKDKWFNLHGMNRDDAANLFLGEACPLVSETDGTCNPNKETIDREYDSCIEMYETAGIPVSNVESRATYFLDSWSESEE